MHNTGFEQPACIETELPADGSTQLRSGNCKSGKALEIIKVG